ncbi:anthranilate synthase beta subunit 1 chloroplastic [Phtheirospermum japonicum]|uniref:anthranilate synthase n=1 Tax=Phtheirospermum japonicum TaxID=374723 RepID=A0A830BC14_9LAMI|nr:anthranilate synthase beta subunit 1 chloroplastic [Phtheirospermum japonicum]
MDTATLAHSVSLFKTSSIVLSPQMTQPLKTQSVGFFTSTHHHHRILSYSAPPKTPLAISGITSVSPVNSSSSKRNTSPIVVIDNYDSFTYNLCQYMGELGCEFEVYRNDELTVDELKQKNPRGILISPGPGAPQDSGISLQTVLELGPTVPLFGVCMGLQCIGEAFGVWVIILDVLTCPFTAGRYHSLVIEKESFPSDVLEITAWTEDGLIMGARHKVHRHLQGVQFHPESIITSEGKTMVHNFIKLIERKEDESKM